MRVLVDFDVPSEAIAVLGKGLGFVPTPSPDIAEIRLDARRIANKITYFANKLDEQEHTINTTIPPSQRVVNSGNMFSLPRKLQIPSYFQSKLTSTNPEMTSAINHLNTFSNSVAASKKSEFKKNLSHLEEIGLKWLREMVKEDKLSICKADKGGATLLVPPEFLIQKVKEKVENPDLYKFIDGDPRKGYHDDLIQLWKDGKDKSFVSEIEAKQIVGITEKNNKSTSSRFKYGSSYFTPSLKIHKLKPEDIKPGCDVPIRLITSLQEGVTKRSDVFVAENWLRKLQEDYCADLVKDTIASLQWLEGFNKSNQIHNKRVTPFTFDFDSLYDRLDPDVVISALRDAMCTCRVDWPVEFKDWLISLIKLSIEASVGEFQNKFYVSRKGLPTGGSIIVELANIAVYYVMRTALYSDKELMKGIISIRRYIDDGVGLHVMTRRQFDNWKTTISKRVASFGLKIKDTDWTVPQKHTDMVNFLDINFTFDNDGTLQTDLYRKPTDARCYLNFSSCHPNYTFSGVAYSQGSRLRRIINNDERLQVRLTELTEDFCKCGYPRQMLKKIFDKVLNTPRSLEKKKKNLDDENEKMMVISTYGRDKPLKDTVDKIEKQSDTLSFQFVKKTASSLSNILVNSKNTSLGPKFGNSVPCNKKKTKKCLTCPLMSKKNFIYGPNLKLLYTSGGNCSSRMLIYRAQCKHCSKVYVGKTVQTLADRVSGHRSNYYTCITSTNLSALFKDDEHLLGLHLYCNHHLQYRQALNESYIFSILEKCSPNNIDLKEHLWIHRLKCIVPFGLNSHDPFGIPLVL